MIYIVWEFEVTAENRVCFEAAYNGDGVWARLFRRDPAYRQTILVKEFDRPGGYLTIDVWEDQDSYLRFKDRFADDYRKIDEECERLTARERPIGVFEQVPSAIAAHPQSVDRRTE